ncbi:uncharacterized protein LOC127123731 [Lathyrus oleraceus]|uniref:uncharacterized protein LOC127123731 n=1 Tax=Pisum sativum TaxID=3888 RepID=UPI0021D3894F|nr:uncharacterized protein LOC127123731 [Pisum sativum]
MVLGHVTPIRNARTSASRKGKPFKVSTSSSPSMTARNVKIVEPSTTVKKPQSMTSLYLDPVNVEPNVGASEECPVIPNVMEDVEASKPSNKPMYVTTLSKSSMIISDKDNVDKNISVLFSHVLGIEPKTGVVSDVSTSLAQPDNTTETPQDKSDVNMLTLSPEKSKYKVDYERITGDLADKGENSAEKKYQSTNIVNIEDLDSDYMPIGQGLASIITKRLKNRKGQDIESSSRPSKSLRNRTSVGPTKRLRKDIISTARKQASGKKIPANIPEVPIDNISFHSVENVKKWKFVYQRRLALERELGKDAYECKEVMSLIQEAGLMKTITGFGKCYEMLVKEFIMNMSKECDNKRRKEFRKMIRKINHEILIKVLSEEEGNFKGDGTCEEDANEEGSDASDDEETTNNDED